MRDTVFTKLVYFSIAGGAGGVIGDTLTEPFSPYLTPTSWILLVVLVGFWFAVAGSLMSVGILMAQSFYLRRRVFEQRVLIGGLSGFAAAMASGSFAQAVYQTIGSTEPLRVVCWGIAGALLGLALSFQMTNLRFWRGLVGGACGGVVGGLVFIAISTVTDDVVGRIVGLGLIGASIGAMLALSEAVAQNGWLEVRYTNGERRNVALGPTRVTIGSSQTQCVIIVPGVSAVSHAIWMVAGDILCEDVATRKKRQLQPDEVLKIGRATIRVKGARRLGRRLKPSAVLASTAASGLARPPPRSAAQRR